MRVECAFGDTMLTSRWLVTDVVRPLAPRTVETEDVTNRDGDVLMGARYGSYEVSLSIWVKAPYGQQPDELVQIAHALDCDTPQRLWFSDEKERYRLALPDGSRKVARYANRARVSVSFLVPDPVLYGRHVSVTVPSGGHATIHVNGTYPTRPSITALSAVRSSASGVWGIRLDDGDFVNVPLASSAARKVELDCAERACLVAGSPALPTLDSDWFELKPGQHAIVNHQGTGSCTVEWDERWL